MNSRRRKFVFAETGRTGEATAVFYRLTVEHPDLPEPFNNLAVLHALRGDYEAVLERLQFWGNCLGLTGAPGAGKSPGSRWPPR